MQAQKTITSTELLAEFAAMLVDKTGLYFPKERFGDLEKKMMPMMVSSGFDSLEDCLRWLMRNPLQKKQIHDLAYHLTIGETYFFRDARIWNALEMRILPELFKKHAEHKVLRIWSAGCCTGEEPYSVAMLLTRLIPDIKNWTIHLIGSDINREFLRKAELALYSRWSFRTTPKELLAQYFEKQKNGYYQLSSEIKRMVKFVPLNLVDEVPEELDHLFSQMDLILCNNVLMYFSQPQVNNTVSKFAQALTNGGWLGVTGIEAPYVNHIHLVSHHFMSATLFKKDQFPAAAPIPLEVVKPRPVPQPLLPVQSIKSSAPMILDAVLPAIIQPIEKPVQVALSLYQECAELYRVNRYDEVIRKLDQIPKTKEHIREMILLVRTYANQGDLVHALEWCEVALEANKLEPILHYLKAELQLDQEDLEEAAKSLKRAIFLDPEFVAAHYVLGILEDKRGRREAALREFRTAFELLTDCDPEQLLPGTEELTAGRVHDHLAIVCRG